MQHNQIVRAILAGTFIVAGIMAGAGVSSAATTHQSASTLVGPDTREGSIAAVTPDGATIAAPDGTRIQ